MSFFPAYDRCTRCQARRLSHEDGRCPTMPGQRWSSSPVPECGHNVQLAPGCDQCDEKRVVASVGGLATEANTPGIPAGYRLRAGWTLVDRSNRTECDSGSHDGCNRPAAMPGMFKKPGSGSLFCWCLPCAIRNSIERVNPAADAAPVLSDVGRPQICPTCGGGSVYARHLAMEGRACRHATRGTMVIAWYCGEHERQRVKFDNDLPANVTGATISGWNGEILESVKSLAEACKRDVRDCVEDLSVAMEHIRDLEKQLADKVTTRAYEKALIARGRREDRNAARRAKRKVAK